MRKNVIFPIFALTAILFSCASSPEADSPRIPQEQRNEQTAPVPPETENSIATEAPENAAPPEQPASEETVPADESGPVPEPDKITEPQVTDLPPPDEELPAPPEESTPEQEIRTEPVEEPELPELPQEETNPQAQAEVYPVTEDDIQPPDTDSGTEITRQDDESRNGTDEEDVISVDDDEESADAQEPVPAGEAPDEMPDMITGNSADGQPVPSRSVSINPGEYLDIEYPGSGWVYLGSTDGSKGLTYFGRKLGTSGTTFTLLAAKEGTSLLHFYRTDVITGRYIDDYIEVSVGKERTKKPGSRIQAPSYADAVPEKPDMATSSGTDSTPEEQPRSAGEKPPVIVEAISPAQNKAAGGKGADAPSPAAADAPETARPDTESGHEDITEPETSRNGEEISAEAAGQPEFRNDVPSDNPSDSESGLDMLENAKKLYAAGDYAGAKNEVSRFLASSAERRDEALFLLGQTLEAKSGIQDIKGAVDAYRTLAEGFPSSSLRTEASRRLVYLSRFYLEAR